MSTALRRRGGTTAQHAIFVGLDRELTIDTTLYTVVVHDGVTPGGHPLCRLEGPGSSKPFTVGALSAVSGVFSGNVSIGTVSQGRTLNLYSAGATLSITPDNTSGANGVTIETSFVGGGNGPLKLNPNGNPVLINTVTNDGTNALQVGGGIRAAGVLTLSGGSCASVDDIDYLIDIQQPYGSAFGGNGTGITFGSRTNAGNAVIGAIHSYLLEGSGPSGGLQFKVKQAGVLYTRMILSPAGNLLVNNPTDDGVNKLQVDGGIKVSGNVEGFVKANISNSVVPTANYQMTFTMPTGNSSLRLNVRGSDGVTRVADIALT